LNYGGQRHVPIINHRLGLTAVIEKEAAAQIAYISRFMELSYITDFHWIAFTALRTFSRISFDYRFDFFFLFLPR